MLTPDIDTVLAEELEITTNWGVKRKNSGKKLQGEKGCEMYHEERNCLEEMVVGGKDTEWERKSNPRSLQRRARSLHGP